jgi:hypothetical protein
VELGTDFVLHRMASFGPLIAFDAIDAANSNHLYLADLRDGSVHTIVALPAQTEAWSPALTATRAAWLELTHGDPQNVGTVTSWRLVVEDLASRLQTVVARGQLTAAEGIPSEMHMAGDWLAYGIPYLGDNQTAWQIMLIRLPDNTPTRAVKVPGEIFHFDVDENGTVAFTAGQQDPQSLALSSLHLYLSTPQRPDSRPVANDAYELSLGGGRVAWMADAEADAAGSAAPMTQVIKSMRLDGDSPHTLSLPVNGQPELGANYPSAMGDLVAWRDFERGGPAGAMYHLALWSAQRATTVDLGTLGHQLLSVSIRGGWITWYVDLDVATPEFRGMPVDALPR